MTDPQSHPIIADEASRIIALLDAFADSPVTSDLMLHDRADCIVAYGVRLWASSRRLRLENRVLSKPEVGEWDSLRTEVPGIGSVTVISAIRPYRIEPVAGVVVTWPTEAA